MSNLTAILAIGSLALLFWKYTTLGKIPKAPGQPPLPPGPKGYPIIVQDLRYNLFNPRVTQKRPNLFLPAAGEVVYFKVFGQGYLLLGSSTTTNDIFEKRSANYSDRTEMPMLIDLMGWHFNMAFMRYTPWWRRHRRAFHEEFHAGVVARYHPIQIRETHAFLRRLLTSPDNWMHHIRHSFAAIIMDISYGIKVEDTDDPYISNAEDALQGAGFKRKAAHWRKANYGMLEKPYEHVKKSMDMGTVPQSLAAKFIEALPAERDENRAEREQIAKDTAAMAYTAGADTTVSAVQTFFLAMAMYPVIQQRAQAEIDSVVGPNRLPNFDDRQSLPYINAMIKETMRWQPVTPLGVGHMCSNNDEYRGYLIPGGTLVLGNVWTILHNPELYPSPEDYVPERWLKDGQLNPNAGDPISAFGFGRRICPGRHFSDSSLYIMIAHTLSVFNIAPPLDDQGKPIRLQPNPTSGLLSYPAPFKCTIKPRSQFAETLIKEDSHM